jgi:hypothetical protein
MNLTPSHKRTGTQASGTFRAGILGTGTNSSGTGILGTGTQASNAASPNYVTPDSIFGFLFGLIRPHLRLVAALIVFTVITLPHHPVQAQSLIPAFGEARSGTSGFQFTKIGADARSAGMGFSNMAVANDASSFYWNPALAAEAERSEFMLSHTQYFADISMEYASYLHRAGSFAIGGSLQYLNSGDMKETTEFMPFGTGRTFRTVHLSAGLTVSQKLTDLFSYGITVRYLMERIEEVELQTPAFDFGFFYRVGDTGLKFSVALNNFGFDASPSGETVRTTLNGDVVEDTFEDVSLPTRFIIATAYDVWQTDTFSAVITGQITNPSDNAEQFSMGTELGYMQQFFLRTGYQFGYDEIRFPSFGAGVKLPVMSQLIAADYSFSPYDRLGNLHRIGLRIQL